MSGANGEGVARTPTPQDGDSGLQLPGQSPEVVRPHAGEHGGLTPVRCPSPSHDRDCCRSSASPPLGPGGPCSHPNAPKTLKLICPPVFRVALRRGRAPVWAEMEFLPAQQKQVQIWI